MARYRQSFIASIFEPLNDYGSTICTLAAALFVAAFAGYTTDTTALYVVSACLVVTAIAHTDVYEPWILRFLGFAAAALVLSLTLAYPDFKQALYVVSSGWAIFTLLRT